MSTLTMSLRKALFNAPPPLPSSPPWYMICGGKRGVRTTHHAPTHHATTHRAKPHTMQPHTMQPHALFQCTINPPLSARRPPPYPTPYTRHRKAGRQGTWCWVMAIHPSWPSSITAPCKPANDPHLPAPWPAAPAFPATGGGRPLALPVAAAAWDASDAAWCASLLSYSPLPVPATPRTSSPALPPAPPSAPAGTPARDNWTDMMYVSSAPAQGVGLRV